MKLTFWGAARQVTGSMHMLTLESGYTILIDCGLDYEHRRNFEEDNRSFPFQPENIDLVILTHSHIDHSGNLPNLVRQGFSGKILCSDVTIPLVKYLLYDSLNVQQIEQNKLKTAKKFNKNKKGKFHSVKSSQPLLYTRANVEQTIDSMGGIPFVLNYAVNDEVELQFLEAGHILGAASVIFSIKENGKTIRVGFTGDLGNYGSKLVKDPTPLPNLDYLITESTYGGRFHTSADPEEVLLQYINDTCVKFNGKLVIPAFSVGRTQAIIFAFNQLFRKGLLPDVKIFTDSPLAIRTTKLYHEHINVLNTEAQEFYGKYGNLFEFDNLHTVEDPKESEMISLISEPCVIISAAGMVEGGRIQEHVRNNISNPYSTILIAGFCAEGTLGHDLLQGRPTVNINKRERQVFSKIARTDAFSAHPDQNGLLRFFKECDSKNIKQVFFVHGEGVMMDTLKIAANEASGVENITIPEKGQSFELS
ncbi:MAG: MBL fold metallo-hydrolase [Bacteroidia bacterium]|nr:MBL fold metallo-hydrolase [Bacteroidia bacterium]